MDFYAAGNMADQLLIRHKWKLNRCRRQSDESIRYFVIDSDDCVLTPTTDERRVGLSLIELLRWMEECGDRALSISARLIRSQLAQAVVIGSK